MSKSRMFGDDEPDNPNPSPRTTIVGGRPPEESNENFPVPVGIQSLLRLAAEDKSFEKELVERRADVAEAAGIELTQSEKQILKVITADQLTSMVGAIPPAPAPRRDFLRKTAATAVLLLGGAALDGCDSCSGKVTGARPDIPPEPQPKPHKGITRGIKPDIPEPKPERPEERPSPPGGARPDVPEPKPKPEPKPDDQFAKPPKGWDGGTPKEPDEPKPERPERPPITKGIRPDPPPKTRGIQPDIPPPKKPPKKKEKK